MCSTRAPSDLGSEACEEGPPLEVPHGERLILCVRMFHDTGIGSIGH